MVCRCLSLSVVVCRRLSLFVVVVVIVVVVVVVVVANLYDAAVKNALCACANPPQ